MKSSDVIAHFGGPAETAKALKITVQAVAGWRDEVPPLRQLHVEKITKGKFKAAHDVFEQLSKRHKQAPQQ